LPHSAPNWFGTIRLWGEVLGYAADDDRVPDDFAGLELQRSARRSAALGGLEQALKACVVDALHVPKVEPKAPDASLERDVQHSMQLVTCIGINPAVTHDHLGVV
jgi:hypothetical protein